MTEDEKGKVKVDTVVGMINGGMAAASGTMLVKKVISCAAARTATGAAAKTVAGVAAKTVAGTAIGTLGRTAAATTLTAVACPAVVTALTVGSVLFGICSIVKAFSN